MSSYDYCITLPYSVANAKLERYTKPYSGGMPGRGYAKVYVDDAGVQRTLAEKGIPGRFDGKEVVGIQRNDLEQIGSYSFEVLPWHNPFEQAMGDTYSIWRGRTIHDWDIHETAFPTFLGQPWEGQDRDTPFLVLRLDNGKTVKAWLNPIT